MLRVSSARAGAAPIERTVARPRAGAAAFALVALATAATLVGAVLLVLLQPLYLHAGLDWAGSARALGVSREDAHRLSDRTVAELLAPAGSFSFPAPGTSSAFYDASEAAHLRDVRVVLYAFLALVALSAAGLVVAAVRTWGEAWPWRAMSVGAGALAVAVVLAGALSLVAFDRAFELFHRVLFPDGNWAFDPTRQRLVQLYPIAFWQLTSWAFGVLTVGAATLVWLFARRRARAARGAA